MKKIKILFVLLCTSLSLYSQNTSTSVSGSLTSEGIYNVTDGHTNWVNMLEMSIERPLWHNGLLSIQLLSTNNLRQSKGKSGICDDLNIFSAIENEDTPLALFMFGISQQWGKFNLFAGVRNVNNDYCTSPWNSMFTASTNGLLPIISHNYPISDSPLSAMSLHAEWSITELITFKSTLYNGVAGNSWDERFRFRPKQDGMLSISEINLNNPNEKSYLGNYALGFVYGNVRNPDTGNKKANWSLWSIIEQPIYQNDKDQTLAILLQGGISPKHRSNCNFYGGVGAVWRGIANDDDYAGVLVNRSNHIDDCETAVELTYSYSFKNLTLQPAIHRVFANRDRTILMLRAVFDFSL